MRTQSRNLLVGYCSCYLLNIKDSGRVFMWGKLHKQSKEESKKQYFGFAVKMPGLKTQQMVEESITEYFKGYILDVC